ncbi:hypothetical protein T265_03642 [Opisthorchis viverrini]|uniref:Uncharacterized protein n=1 Tax=Opisthorchis viverrini TaxID=6198 RepID=A0A075AHG6_OPIVI|nr:hypothetical protein T265_03642 [Opisthorchis viverrini]KER29849.1 hypothetical protein T265_03642 [Opisthorchis viverrini]
MSAQRSVTNTIYLDIENKSLCPVSPSKANRSRRYSLSFDGRNGDAFTCQGRQTETIKNTPLMRIPNMYQMEPSALGVSECHTDSIRTTTNSISHPAKQKQQAMSMSTSLIEERAASERPLISHEMAVRLLKEYVRSLKDFSSLLQSRQDRETKDSATSPIHSPVENVSGRDPYRDDTRHSASYFRSDISPKSIDNHYNMSRFPCTTDPYVMAPGHDQPISVNDLFAYIRKTEKTRDDRFELRTSPSSSHDSLSSAPPILSTNYATVSANYSNESGQRTPVNVEDISFPGTDCESRKFNKLSSTYRMSSAEPTSEISFDGTGPFNSRLNSTATQPEHQHNGSLYKHVTPSTHSVKSEAAFHRPYTQMLWPADKADSTETESNQIQISFNGEKANANNLDYIQKASVPLGLPTYTKTKADWKDIGKSLNGGTLVSKAASLTDTTNAYTSFQRNGFHRTSTTSPNTTSRLVNHSNARASDEFPSPITSSRLQEEQRRREMTPSTQDKPPKTAVLPLERVSKTITNLGQFPVSPSVGHVEGNNELKRIQLLHSTADRDCASNKPNSSQTFIGFHSSTTYTHPTPPSATVRLSPSLSSTKSRPMDSSLRLSSSTLSGSQSVDSMQSHGYGQADTSLDKTRLDEPLVVETRRSQSDWKRPSLGSLIQKNDHQWSSTTSPPLHLSNHSGSGSSRYAPRTYNSESSPSPSSPKPNLQAPSKWNFERPSTITSNVQRPLSINVGTSNSWINHPIIPEPLRTNKSDTATQTDELLSPSSLTPTNSSEFNLSSECNSNGGRINGALETWPLSLQSVVKPLHADLHSPQSSRNGSDDSSFQSDLNRHIKESSWAGTHVLPPTASTTVRSPNLPSSNHSVVRRLSLRGLRPSSLEPSPALLNQRMSLLRSSRSSSSGVSSPGSSGHSDAPRCRSVHFSTDVLVAHTGAGPEPLLLSSAPLKEPAPVDVSVLKNSFPPRSQGIQKRGSTVPRIPPGPSSIEPSISKLDTSQSVLFGRPPATTVTRKPALSRNSVEHNH